MNILTVVILVIVGLALAFGATRLTGFLTATTPTSQEKTPTPALPAAENAVAFTADENPATPERDITVNAVIGSFEPDVLTVKKGEPVKITLHVKSIDPNFTSHGFSIMELGVNERASVGKDTTFTFTPDRSGTFRFFCSVSCGEGHRDQSGTITVV